MHSPLVYGAPDPFSLLNTWTTESFTVWSNGTSVMDGLEWLGGYSEGLSTGTY